MSRDANDDDTLPRIFRGKLNHCRPGSLVGLSCAWCKTREDGAMMAFSIFVLYLSHVRSGLVPTMRLSSPEGCCILHQLLMAPRGCSNSQESTGYSSIPSSFPFFSLFLLHQEQHKAPAVRDRSCSCVFYNMTAESSENITQIIYSKTYAHIK